MTDKETAQGRIANLTARYEGRSPARRKALSEMDTRRVFILPLFDALGWDTTGNPDEVAEEVSGAAGRAASSSRWALPRRAKLLADRSRPPPSTPA